MTDLGPIDVKRLQGDERFHDNRRPMGFRVLDFWQWSASDLVSNATRGILAEFLVAQALGVADDVRDEWAAWDLTAPDGTRVEVKSAAYIQSWHQDRLSRISFRIPKTHAWDRASNRSAPERRRQAHVYVFAILAHKEQATLDPLDLSQWEFHVVPTALLDRRTRSQHSITLPSLRKLAGDPVHFEDLASRIEKAAVEQRMLES
ncbi:MAG: hypothetical protein D6738_10110 [Acidobacteria bacterium]|nr:MAG: hypothetical protein D6738_10110 [Acidobacteriota bacterium]